MSDDLNQLNPYEAAAMPGIQAVGEVKKPASVVVFGILNMVYGALGTLMIVFVILSLFLDLPKDPDSPFEQALENPTYKLINVGVQIGGGLLAIVLLASGIGLINGKLFGRRLAIIYAIATILLVIAGSIVNIIFVSLPAFARASELPDGAEKFVSMVVGSSIFIQPICGNIYPVLLLIFMMRQPVKNTLGSDNKAERQQIFVPFVFLCAGS